MEKYENIIITMYFDEETIQGCAESTIGRELTDLELNRLALCWYDFDSTGGVRNEVMSQFVEEVVNHEDSWADEEYYKRKKI